jgi:ubiquinol-cytochrome c reductase cytochrome c1 subunit
MHNFLYALFVISSFFVLISSPAKSNDHDVVQIRRGLQVFQEVCSACHAAQKITVGKLYSLGITKDEISKFSEIIDDSSSPFLSPYESEFEAFISNNGAIPGDLSDLYQVRRDAASYTFQLLTSYRSPPPSFSRLPTKLTAYKHYNSAFANRYIAMAPPLVSEGQVTFVDGTQSTVDQMSKDVAVFLHYTSNR